MIPTLIVLWASIDIPYRLVNLFESMVDGSSMSDTQAATVIILGAIY